LIELRMHTLQRGSVTISVYFFDFLRIRRVVCRTGPKMAKWAGSVEGTRLCFAVQVVPVGSHARLGHTMQSQLSSPLQVAKHSVQPKPDPSAPASPASNLLQMPSSLLHRQHDPDPANLKELARERADRAAFAAGIRSSHNQLQASYRAALRQGALVALVGTCAFATVVMMAIWISQSTAH
jgi:hypothetical protein